MVNLTAHLAHQVAAEERDQRLAAIKRSWDYFEGRHPKALKVKPGQADDNIIVNLARPIVEKGISLLFGKPLTIQIDEDGSRDSKAEQYLKAVLKANKQALMLHKLGQNGAMAGLAFIKVNPQPAGQPPRLVVLDPATVEPHCSAEDVDDIDRYRIQYSAMDANGKDVTYRQDITRDESGQRWSITNYKADRMGVFVRQGEPIVWPYAWAPVLHCQNLPAANSIWGYGDLDDASLNDALNSIASYTRKIIRLHGHPKTIGKGFTAEQLKSFGPDDMWYLPSNDADVFNLEMQSDLAAAREFYQQLRAAIYATARIPDMASVGNLGTLTNFGLRVLFADALEKTDTKRVTYGSLIEELCQHLCELGGFGPDIQVSITWPDPLPVDTTAKATEVINKQKTGLISDETLTAELGDYDYQDEQARLKQQRAVQPQTATVPTPISQAAAPATIQEAA